MAHVRQLQSWQLQFCHFHDAFVDYRLDGLKLAEFICCVNERWINSFRVPHATWTYGLGTKEHLVSTKQGQCTTQRIDEKGKPDFDEVTDHAQSIATSLFC